MNSAECDEMPEELRNNMIIHGIDPDSVVCWRKTNGKKE